MATTAKGAPHWRKLVADWVVYYKSTDEDAKPDEKTLVIEAASEHEAYAIAYDALLRKGRTLTTPTTFVDPELGTEVPIYNLGLSLETLRELGVPLGKTGSFIISAIEPHSVAVEGRVVRS
jgi:hypothetical protein